MNARHTKQQEKYRFHMFYTNTFFLILTFVSYNYHFEGHNCNLSEFGHKSSRTGIIKSSNIQIIKSESYLTIEVEKWDISEKVFAGVDLAQNHCTI